MAFMAENIYSIRPIKMIDGHFQNRTVELPNSDVDANSLLSSLHLEVPSFEFARYIQVDSSISDPYIVCKVHFLKSIVGDCLADCASKYRMTMKLG
jgi:hypothetical protein